MSTSRAVSALLYLVYVTFVVAHCGEHGLFAVAAGTLIPVVLIWFPEEVNDVSQGMWWGGPVINRPTPPAFIAAFGWVLLVLTVVAGAKVRFFS